MISNAAGADYFSHDLINVIKMDLLFRLITLLDAS